MKQIFSQPIPPSTAYRSRQGKFSKSNIYVSLKNSVFSSAEGWGSLIIQPPNSNMKYRVGNFR